MLPKFGVFDHIHSRELFRFIQYTVIHFTRNIRISCKRHSLLTWKFEKHDRTF